MKATAKRLRPGELDGLVLAYLKNHKADGPLIASAIGKGISRSSGGIANCLARLAKEKKVRQAKRKPHIPEDWGALRSTKKRSSRAKIPPRLFLPPTTVSAKNYPRGQLLPTCPSR